MSWINVLNSCLSGDSTQIEKKLTGGMMSCKEKYWLTHHFSQSFFCSRFSTNSPKKKVLFSFISFVTETGSPATPVTSLYVTETISLPAITPPSAMGLTGAISSVPATKKEDNVFFEIKKILYVYLKNTSRIVRLISAKKNASGEIEYQYDTEMLLLDYCQFNLVLNYVVDMPPCDWTSNKVVALKTVLKNWTNSNPPLVIRELTHKLPIPKIDKTTNFDTLTPEMIAFLMKEIRNDLIHNYPIDKLREDPNKPIYPWPGENKLDPKEKRRLFNCNLVDLRYYLFEILKVISEFDQGNIFLVSQGDWN